MYLTRILNRLFSSFILFQNRVGMVSVLTLLIFMFFSPSCLEATTTSCHSCKKYFCPPPSSSGVSQILQGSEGSSFFLHVSQPPPPTTKQSHNNHHDPLPALHHHHHHHYDKCFPNFDPQQNCHEQQQQQPPQTETKKGAKPFISFFYDPMDPISSSSSSYFVPAVFFIILAATLVKIGLYFQVYKITSSIFPFVLLSLFGLLIGGIILYKGPQFMPWDPPLSTSSSLPTTDRCSPGIIYLSVLFLIFFLVPRIISLEQGPVYKLTLLLFACSIFYQLSGSTVPILHCLLLTSVVLPCNTQPLFLLSKNLQTNNIFSSMISQESLISNALSLIVYHLSCGKKNFDDPLSAQPVAWYSSVICVLAVGIEGIVLIFWLGRLLFNFTTKHCSPFIVFIVEAIALLAITILAYFTIFYFLHLPAILELALCGLCIRQYVDAIFLSGSLMMTSSSNGSTKVTSLLKLFACLCESGILALGVVSIPGQAPALLSLFVSSQTWNSTFLFLSLFIGINCTSLGLMCICWWSSNHSQTGGPLDSFIVYSSTLRGGLYAFSLALLLAETDLPQKHILVTSLFAFIFFAIFVQSLSLRGLQNSVKDKLVKSNKQELISSEKKTEKNLLDHLFTGLKDVTELFGYHLLKEGKILMRDHEVPSSSSDRRIRLLQLVQKLNLRTWLQHVTAYGGGAGSSSATTRSTPSLPPPTTAAAMGAFSCAQASISPSGTQTHALQKSSSSQHSASPNNVGRISSSGSGRRKKPHRKAFGVNQTTELHSKLFVPNCGELERHCGEDSGVMVDEHSEEEDEDSHLTSSSALGGACCGPASCTGIEGGTKFADDCQIHHFADHNSYRPRHKWSKLKKSSSSSKQSNYAVFHQELCLQLEKLCSNRTTSNKEFEEDVPHKLSCFDAHQLRTCDLEGYLKNMKDDTTEDMSSRFLLTTPKQQRDLSATSSEEEEDAGNMEMGPTEMESAAAAAAIQMDLIENADSEEVSHGFHYRLPWLDETQSSPPTDEAPPPPAEETIAEKTLPWKCPLVDTSKAPLAEAEEVEMEQKTLAETTLPWKRQSAREPICAAMSLNVVEDEPQAAEAPSWINNLLYHRLKESGSPYLSPEDTLTLVHNISVSRPSIFSVFPTETVTGKADTVKEEKAPSSRTMTTTTTTGRLLPPPLAAEVECGSIALPPPWESHNSGEYEPLTSPHATNTNIGDKVCSSESMHRLLPPTHHHIIVPLTPGNTNESLSDLESAVERGALRSPASAPNFPTHWQMLLPSLRDRRHSTSLTEEQAYEEDCLQRVQNWLDNVEPGLDGVVDLDKFDEQHFFVLDDDQLDDTYDADLEDEDLEETIV